MNNNFKFVFTLAVLMIAGVASADNPTVKVFQEKCAMCHGPDGKAQTTMGKLLKMNDWSDGKTLNAMSDADVTKEIQVGKAKMPGFATWPADQIKALVEYVRTFQK